MYIFNKCWSWCSKKHFYEWMCGKWWHREQHWWSLSQGAVQQWYYRSKHLLGSPRLKNSMVNNFSHSTTVNSSMLTMSKYYAIVYAKLLWWWWGCHVENKVEKRSKHGSIVLAKHVEHKHSKVFMKYCCEFEAKLSMSND